MKKKLLVALAKPMADDFGYTYVSSEQQYRKTFSGGRTTMHVAFANYSYEMTATVDIAIRLDIVEDVVARHSRPGLHLGKQSWTAGAELGNLETSTADTPGKRHVIDICSEGDIPTAVNEMLDIFRRVGIPALEEWKNLNSLLTILRGRDRTSSLISPLIYDRAVVVCALLFVLKRHDEIEEIGFEYLRKLESEKNFQTEAFHEFLDNLLTEVGTLEVPDGGV